MKDTQKTNATFYVATYEAVNDEPVISEVIAVFVDEIQAVINSEIYYSSYAHFGQHSDCSQSFLRENCRKARKEEYQDLFNELENVVGYNLKVV
jgi:hypothetical protein